MMETSEHSIEDVAVLLTTLRLSTLATTVRELCYDPKFAEKGYIDQLHLIFSSYAEKLKFNRYKRLKKESQLPDLPLYDIQANAEQRNLFQLVIDGISTNSRERREVVICMGSTGLGKTNYAMKIIDELLQRGIRADMTDYSLLIFTLKSFLGTEAYENRLKALAKHKAYLLDDFFLRAPVEGEASILKDILDHCQISGCSLILTTQLPFEEWAKHIGPGIASEAALSRLTNGPLVIKFSGESKRNRTPMEVEFK